MLRRITSSKKKPSYPDTTTLFKDVKDLRLLEVFSLFISFTLSLLANYFDNEYLLFGALVAILITLLLYLKIKLHKDKLIGVGTI